MGRSPVITGRLDSFDDGINSPSIQFDKRNLKSVGLSPM